MGEKGISALPYDKLEKTSAEQAIIRSIQQLELELAETEDEYRKRELGDQLAELRKQLAGLQGPSYSELERENELLKSSLHELQMRLAAYERECSALKNSPHSFQDFASLSAERDNQFRLYRLLLQKYAPLINDSEKKTVGEIKGLISSEDLSLQSLIEDLKPDSYSFEKDYLETAGKVFDFITREIAYAKADLKLNFWLSHKEILSEKVGDDEDLAVLLCSALYALGDERAEVVIAEVDNLTTHAFVITEFNGEFILLDPSQKKPFGQFTGRRKEVIKAYSFKGVRIKRFLYRFNSTNYEQFF